MTLSDYLRTLEFNSFERYPKQFMSVYLKCEGEDKRFKRYVCKFLRMNNFNAATFDPEEAKKALKNKFVDWRFSWTPADPIDKKKYD